MFISILTEKVHIVLVDGLASNNYDILMGDVTITAERQEIIDFSFPIDTTDLIFVRKIMDNMKYNKFSFLMPLSFEVWISIFVSLLAGS